MPPRLDRRSFLASLPAAAGLAAHDPREPPLPEPDLGDARVVRRVAGLRPWRAGGIRLAAERVAGKTVVHNYGHGGAGVSLSWGTAEAAADLVAAAAPPPQPVAVVGAGAVGLATARVLQERGHRVRVLAKDFPPHTTSDLACAEWLPFGVAIGEGDEARERFVKFARASWRRFRALEGDAFGVHLRPHYEVGNAGRLLASVPDDTIRPPIALDKLPFARVQRRGEVFHTLLIEPPVYLAAMLRAVLVAGGTLAGSTFTAREELGELPEKIIVNCTGLGARALFADEDVQPVRGQLVHVFAQQLPYLLSHEGGHLIPRRDCLVLGGTFEVGIDDDRADPDTCARILADHRRFFAGS